MSFKPPALVIVAEDEFLVRMSALTHLEEAGFEVLEAEHAQAVLQHFDLRGADVRLLFTDIHMPGVMNGLSLAHHVTRHWPGVAILIASGEARPLPGDLPGGSRFLPKPYELDRMLGHVREMVAA